MLEGKKILVAGATGHMGEQIACFLVQSGAVAVLVGRNTDKLKKIEDSLHGSALSIAADLTKSDEIEKVFHELKAKEMKLDGLVYCAGVCFQSAVKMTTEDELLEMFRINTMAFYLLAKYCSMPKYSNSNCSIVTISSMASRTNEAGLSLYSMTKSAMNSAVRSMAKEFVKRRIRVNAILPAEVMSKMASDDNEWTGEEIKAIQSYQPYGPIPIEQIVYCVAFLLSDHSSYITGECIAIGGGYQIKKT